MGLFTMPDGSSGSDVPDDSSSDPTSGDGSLSSLFDLNGIGSGYGVTTYTDPPPSTSVASDLGSLQSGSTTSSPLDLTNAFDTTLGTIVALDAINNQPTTASVGAGYYRGADGNVYLDGTGPGAAGTVGTASGGSLLFWLLIIGGLVLFAKEEHV